jgi:hypothetical protein
VLALERRFGARGLRVIGVTKDGEDEAERKHVAETAKEEKMTYPSFLDIDGSWTKASRLGMVPAFLVVGKHGRLLYRYSGKLVEGTPQFDEVAAAIDRALAASG